MFNGPVSSARRLVPVPEGYSPSRTVGVLRHGASDPRLSNRCQWLVVRPGDPDGPATLSLRRTDDGVEAQGWGDGAAWAVDNAPHLLGCDDDPAGFVAHDALAAEGARVMAGWRVARSRLVVPSLVPAIIEQRVTGKEAFAGHTRLVRRFGSPAPGPGADLGPHGAARPA